MEYVLVGSTPEAKEAAEKVEKQTPRGLKAARNDKNKRLNGTTEVVP
jgi:hypothetical protein